MRWRPAQSLQAHGRAILKSEVGMQACPNSGATELGCTFGVHVGHGSALIVCELVLDLGWACQLVDGSHNCRRDLCDRLAVCGGLVLDLVQECPVKGSVVALCISNLAGSKLVVSILQQ